MRKSKDQVKKVAIAIVEGRMTAFSEGLKDAAIDTIAKDMYEASWHDADFIYDVIINGHKGLQERPDKEVALEYLECFKPGVTFMHELGTAVEFSLKSYDEEKLKSNQKLKEMMKLYKFCQEDHRTIVKDAIIKVINEECDDE